MTLCFQRHQCDIEPITAIARPPFSQLCCESTLCHSTSAKPPKFVVRGCAQCPTGTSMDRGR